MIMSQAHISTLLESIASTIADYRLGEIAEPDASHVDRWVSQFDPGVKLLLLEELDHVLKQTYVSQADMTRFLGSLVTNEKFTGGDHSTFWARANVLRLQNETKSQHAMLATLEDALQTTLGLRFGGGKDNAPFIYLDDGLFGGGTIRQDLRAWIQGRAPTTAKVHIVVLAYYRSGGFYSMKHLRDMAKAAGKTIDLTLWRLIEFEDRLSDIDRSDVLRPTHIVGDLLVEAYAAKLEALGRPPRLRTALSVPGGSLFRSAAGRDALEWELLRAGCRILDECNSPSRVMRPLGVSTLDTLGFGALFVTHRNCPNNCPLAVWWGEGDGAGALGWYPLFPRRPLEDTATFFRRLSAGAQEKGAAKQRLSADTPRASDHDEDDSPWEAEAREAVEHALDELTFDFEDGVAVAPHERGQTVFEDLDSLVSHLSEVYDEAWYANVPFEGGEAVFESDGLGEASEALDGRYPEELDRLGWR
jgi:hypothetical protein